MPILWEPELDDEAKRWVDVAKGLNEQYFAPLATEIDRDQRYPWEHVEKLVESGLSGLAIPKQYGGEGAALTTLTAVMMELCRACASTGAIWVSAHSGRARSLRSAPRSRRLSTSPRSRLDAT